MRLIDREDAAHWLRMLPATCDWGGCDRPTTGVRYSISLEQALAVCDEHEGPAA